FLTVGQVTIEDPVKFLLEIASRVRSLRIKQNFAPEISHDAKYVFGTINADRMAIILDIFKRKADKLMIENVYQAYLIDCLDVRIQESLAQQDKKVWFSACFGDESELHEYERNGYVVQVGTDYRSINNSVEIKHISRRD
ncbi:hypothetical protein PMAYCL1PPCAC_19997, partial [Pristionchus mayeri]